MVIKNGRLLDGTGNPSFKADVGITNGRITKIGKVRDDSAKSINAQGLIVSPGFIDPHSHSDRYIPLGPEVHSTIHQGITTLCVGNCGSSLASLPVFNIILAV